MIKEVKENMASMFSLMERMERHMSGFQADENKKSYLREAMGGKALYLTTKVNVVVDNSVKNNVRRAVKIVIGNITQESLKRAQQKWGYTNGCTFNALGGYDSFITMKKLIPASDERKHRNTQQADTQGDDNSVQPDGVDFNMDGIDIDSMADALNESDDFDFGDFDLDAMADSIKNGSDKQNVSDVSSTESPVADSSKVDKDVWDWINTTYKQILDSVTNNGTDSIYDADSIKKAYDLDDIFGAYLTAKHNPERSMIYVDKTSDEILKEVTDALNSGDYMRLAQAAVGSPLNLEAWMFGDQLSGRNIGRFLRQAANRGLQPPTSLYGRTQWRDRFNRKLVPGAVPYYGVGNNVGRQDYDNMADVAAGNIDIVNARGKNSGSIGHKNGKVHGRINYAPVTLYDISDTALIDPSLGDPYNDMPGVVNNLTGGINDKARDYLAKRKESIPEELIQQIESIGTEGGKARLYNMILGQYVQEKNLNVPFEEIPDGTDDNTSVITYVNNVYLIATDIANRVGYASDACKHEAADASAFCICFYTVGLNKLNVASKNHRTNVKNGWKERANDLLEDIRIVHSFIASRVETQFAPIRNKIQEIVNAEIAREKAEQAAATAQADNQAASQPQDSTNADAALNESYNLRALIMEIKNL